MTEKSLLDVSTANAARNEHILCTARVCVVISYIPVDPLCAEVNVALALFLILIYDRSLCLMMNREAAMAAHMNVANTTQYPERQRRVHTHNWLPTMKSVAVKLRIKFYYRRFYPTQFIFIFAYIISGI